MLFGIDENLLTSAFDAGLFQPYEAVGLKDVPAQFQVDPEHRVTPIDHGDVCVNYDRTWFTDQGLPLPTTFADLTQPALKGKLVVQDPSASTPGLAFMLGHHRLAGRRRRHLVVGGLGAVLAAAEGQRREGRRRVGDRLQRRLLRQRRQGRPPAGRELRLEPAVRGHRPGHPARAGPTGVIAATCYRQTEFAGVLAGAAQPEAAAAFIEFMLSLPFQEDVPEQMYVFPVNSQAVLPEAWQRYTTPVADPLAIPLRAGRGATVTVGCSSGRPSSGDPAVPPPEPVEVGDLRASLDGRWVGVVVAGGAGGAAAGLPRRVLRVAGDGHHRPGPAPRRRVEPLGHRRRRHRPGHPPGRLVHPVAGRAVDRAVRRRRPARCGAVRPLPLRRQTVPVGGAARAVRAADGRRRRRPARACSAPTG